MAVNRFTTVKPQEFQQTYDPYPFEEMYKMAQYKQGRADQAMGLAGKLAGENSIESGYFTGDEAQQLMKEREADINRVTQIAGSGNQAATIRAYTESLSKWKNDPRMRSIQSDADLKKIIDARTSQEGYGSDYMFSTQDPTTGQFVPSEATKAKIARGEMLTAQDYGGMENVSDIKAYSPYVNLIKPAITQGYTLVTDPDTGKQVYKETNGTEELTYDIVKERSKGVLEGFKNEDGSVNMEALKATDPELWKNARWKQEALAREGRADQFNWDNLVDDYMDIASLSFYTRGKANITGLGGSGDKEDKPIGTQEMLGSIPITYNATTATNAPAESITDLQSAATSLGIDPITFMDPSIGMSIKDLIYARPNVKDSDIPQGVDKNTYKKQKIDEYDNAFTAKQQQYVESLYNIELDKLKAANPDTEVMGNMVSTMSPVEMEQTARSTAEANMMKRNKLAHALYETNLAFGNQKDKIPTVDKDGNIQGLTTEENALLKKKQKWDQYIVDSQKFREDFESGKLGISKTEYEKQRKEKFTIPFDEFSAFKPGMIEDVKIRNMFDKINGKYVPKRYSEYYDKLDSEIEKSFQTPEFTTTAKLLYNKDGGFSEKEIPFYHKIVSRAAVERVKGGMGVYFKGKELNGFNATGTDSHKGQVLTDLFVAGGKGTDEDATEDFSNGTYIPSKFYYNNVNNKWMARGNFSASNDEGKPITSAEYDVDISENMAEFLTNDAQSELFTRDRAIDILNSTYKGTANVAKFGGYEMESEMFGDMIAYGNPDGTYSIRGKIPTPNGEVLDLQEVIRDRGENPLSLSKDKAAEYLGDAFKYRTFAVEQEKNKNAILGSAPLNSLEKVVLDSISKFEAIGGSYNSMNQGGDEDPITGKVKPIGSGQSTDDNLLGTSLDKLTLAELMDHQSKKRGEPGKIHAAGKYQFIPSTLKDQVSRIGLPLSTKFTPAVQDRLALSYATDIAKRAYSKSLLESQLKSAWHGVANLSETEMRALVDSAWKLAGK